MTNLLEIKAAIKQLPENDVRQLAIWLQNYLNDLCDRLWRCASRNRAACALARIDKSNQI
ncbi:MAG: hypothetical protein WBV73_03355 [Phormidium sp.]